VWLCVILVQLTQAVTGLSKDVQDIKSTLKDQMSPQALLATLILIVLKNAASHGQVSTGTSLSAPEVMTLCPGPGLLCACLRFHMGPSLSHASIWPCMCLCFSTARVHDSRGCARAPRGCTGTRQQPRYGRIGHYSPVHI
jgi:hypothetical protein